MVIGCRGKSGSDHVSHSKFCDEQVGECLMSTVDDTCPMVLDLLVAANICHQSFNENDL